MAVDKEYVEKQLAKVNAKKRLGVGKELKHLHEVINKGENILGHTRGFYNGNTWLVCITDRRVLFLDKGMIYGMKSAEIPLDNVSSVNYETGILVGSITVTAGGAEKKVGKLRKQDVKDISNLISEAAAKAKKKLHSGK
tara:strand:- start:17 stop:433 length:417 start_codon:yes stop_codon:yes gene_type:complete